MHDPFSLEGKTILISGGSSGIGRGIAVACAQQGASVIVLGRNRTTLEETIAICENKEKHHLICVDLSQPGFESFLIDFLHENGPIDGFVHAAGISPTIPFKSIKHKEVQETFSLNLFSAIQLIQLVTKMGIKSRNGMSIVMISSVMSETGAKGKSLYAMTKAALVGMVRSLALEYADKKIRFNAISPSVVNTPLSMKSEYRKDLESMKKVEAQHPLGLGEVEDVAHASVYLLSDASKWVTGTNLIVDGGYLAK